MFFQLFYKLEFKTKKTEFQFQQKAELTALPPDVVLGHAGRVDGEAAVCAVLGGLEMDPDSTLANLAVNSPSVVHPCYPRTTGFVVADENVAPGFEC